MQDPTSNDSKYRRYQIIVFSLTALLYASVHATRTSWAYSKRSILNTTQFDNQALGILDFCFLSAYAIGLLFSGWIADRTNAKLFFSVGLLISALSYSSVGFLEGTLDMENIYAGAVAFVINGLGQATVFRISWLILS